jgi:Xaa-Pro aminopeptidase
MALTPAFDPEVYKKRRAEVLQRMREAAPNGAVAVFPGMPIATRNSDVEHAYRADSDVAFLSGFEEPETVVVLSTASDKPFTLFVRPRDKERKLEEELPKLVGSARTLFYRLGGDDPKFDALIGQILRTLRQRARAGMTAPTRIEDSGPIVHELRLHKDPRELVAMRKAIELTRNGHLAAMKAGRAGTHEYDLHALLEHEFRKQGGRGWGYYPIVAAGANATVLHYTENNVPVRDGDLVLIDAGAEVDLYTADVTRVFPASGRFSPAQRAIYELVLAAADLCIGLTKPGESIDELHEKAVRVLTEGMVKLGLLQGDVDSLIKENSYRRYYMHRTSHYLGMDVHDVGPYRTSEGKPRPLAPGMIFTVEPGLYVTSDDEEAPPEYRGIGVRIEDDILVTENGCENLTIAIPRTVAAVEAACAA